jgi:hypothetical protein
VEKDAKATRSGNARIHGMTCVTEASIAYIATQVCPTLSPYYLSNLLTIYCEQLCFALSLSSTFCQSDTSTDSEQFYESILEFLSDPEELEEVTSLLSWWNR